MYFGYDRLCILDVRTLGFLGGDLICVHIISLR